MLFSPDRRRQPGPRGPSAELVSESSRARKLRDRKPSLFNAFEILDHTANMTNSSLLMFHAPEENATEAELQLE